ncbi:MAG: hypothetical protein ABIA93_06880 [Candidatus Woesearchaeota archaeon]
MARVKYNNGLVRVRITLDEDECLFREKELDYYDKEYLERHSYEYGEFVPIGQYHKEGFYVKRNTRESLMHTFLVHNIKQHLRKHTNDIQVRITKKPDIVFKNKNGKTIALEIETGKNFKRHKQRIKEKFMQAKKNYPLIYIVLASTKKKSYYKRLLPSIPLLVRTDINRFIRAQFKR